MVPDNQIFVKILHITLQKGNTPLHIAAENGHEKIVHLLITRGASINQPDMVRYKLHALYHLGILLPRIKLCAMINSETTL